MKRLKLNQKVLIDKLIHDRSSQNQAIEIWTTYEASFHDSIRNRGKTRTLEIYKDNYNFLKLSLLDLECPVLKFTKVDKLGYPKVLWGLRPLIKGDLNKQRLALTIARIFETIVLPVDKDLSAITDGLQGVTPGELSDFRKNFNDWLNDFIYEHEWLGIPRWSKDLEVWNTLSNGPNGPAVANSGSDLIALMSEPRLYQAIQNLNSLFNQQHFNTMMDINRPDTNVEEGPYYHSRLGFSAEGGGKTRIFAIFDF